MMLQTSRCILSIIQKDDYDDIKLLYTDVGVREFLGGVIEENVFRIKFTKMCGQNKDYLYWVIRQKDDNQFIGLVSLDLHHDGINTEISYQLLPRWWGYGFATEIVKCVLSYAFKDLGLKKIVAETQSSNEASIRMLKRVGMCLEKTVERFGEEQSIFSITNTYKQEPNKKH